MTESESASYTMDRVGVGEFDETVDRVRTALSEEGFGVLCDIDVEGKLREELDADFRRYRILGACNPPLAHQALESELRLGALLPCNVVVYETDDGATGVSAVDPERMLSVVDNPELDSVATEVRTRLERVLDRLPENAAE